MGQRTGRRIETMAIGTRKLSRLKARIRKMRKSRRRRRRKKRRSLFAEV